MRVDGQPVFAAVAIISAAFINVLLDWQLVGVWKMGLQGAALATGAAHITSFSVLLLHFVTKKSVLRFFWPRHAWGRCCMLPIMA